MVSQSQPGGATSTPSELTVTGPSAGGRMCPDALVPWPLATLTWTWQMSFVAVSPAYTPVEGNGEQAVRQEYAGGAAVIRYGLFTVKPVAATPPKVTEVAPEKPAPRIVTFPGADSDPPSGITPVMLGTALAALVSTYSKVESGPGALDSSSLSVT